MAFEFLGQALKDRQEQGLLRKRYPIISNKDSVVEISGQHYLNFASNDYLGLSQHPKVLQAYVEGLAVYGSGAGASPVVTGYSAEHQALEEDICAFSQQEAVLLFSSGFAANQALCHALFSNNKGNAAAKTKQSAQAGQIICDKYMHASFIQGALESSAVLSRFKHNDMQHAQQLLSAKVDELSPDMLVATEGVFSMDGDKGEIGQLQALISTVSSAAQNKKKPWLMVDDAHAIGVIGKDGFGSLDCDDVKPKQVDVLMGTFGKALGCSGAFVAGSVELIEYMVNMSKHYVYSTAFSGAQARAIRCALALVEAGVEREQLHQNIEYFVQKANQAGLSLLPSLSAIQPLIVGEPMRAMAYSQLLAELGLWVPAIRTPTVPKHSDRLRIIITAAHQAKDIDVLLDGLCIARDKLETLSL
jgi:8-amino-7-oxononanoate synthase